MIFSRLEAISKVTGPEGLKPSRVWNAMMYPFTKMTIYGAIWYQGETNAHLGLNHYNCTFPAMIDDWRAKWFKGTQGNTDEVFPFDFVQVCFPRNTRVAIVLQSCC